LFNSKIDFLDENNNVVQKKCYEVFIQLCLDLLFEFYNPLSHIIPFLADSGWYGLPYRNNVNKATFCKALGEFLKKSKDTKSVAYQLRQGGQFTEDEIFCDLVLLMTGGTETSSHALTSIMFFLKKYPEIMKRLKAELEEQGITKENIEKEGSDCITMEKLQEMNYLTCIIKESMRYDSPVSDTFIYQTNEKTEICDVSIPKSSIIKVDIFGVHFNEENWIEPFKFEPDRFNADTVFGKRQKKERGIDPFSSRAFSFGLRSCPGQTFAMIEMKAIVAYLVTMIDYDVPEELFKNEAVGFGLGSKIDSSFTIHKKY
jgi:cytochrome P450